MSRRSSLLRRVRAGFAAAGLATLLVPGIAWSEGTSLELLTVGSPGKEIEKWGSKLTLSVPQAFTLRWSTGYAGATGGDWEVRTFGAGKQIVKIANGTLTQAPAAGTKLIFTVASFLPAQPPATPRNYTIRIRAHDAQNKPLGAVSAVVVITHAVAGPATKIDDDVGGPPAGVVDPGHPSVRFIRYDPLDETNPGKLRYEVFNPSNKQTDAVELRVSDSSKVARSQEASIQIASLAPGARQFVSFTLVPQLVVGSPTLEQDKAKWRQRYSTEGVKLIAGTNKVGKAYVQWHNPPAAGKASRLMCGYAPAAAAAASAELRACVSARVAALLSSSDGTRGLYLKQVQGAVLAGLNESTVFEPASAIKIILSFHAFRRMETDPSLTLATSVPWFMNYKKKADGTDGSCPVDTGAANAPLQTLLTGMMQSSDNRHTQALRIFLIQANINATANGIGMVNTMYQHRDGCGDDAVDHPNKLTLAEAGLLYEGVATGALLKPASRTALYSVMAGKNVDASGVWTDLQAIVAAEAPTAMTAAKKQAFRAAMDTHYKAGGYGLSDGQYRSVAGSVTIPFRAGPNVVPRTFVFGIFIAKASSDSKATAAWAAARAELMREQIREALRTW